MNRFLAVFYSTVFTFSLLTHSPHLLNAEEISISFSLAGKPKTKLALAAVKAKNYVKELKVWEPHEDKNIIYRGIFAEDLLNDVYGDEWKTREEILFTCADGYQPSLPVARFKKFSGFFAFERLDQKTFTLQNKTQNEADVPVGPLYLVWDNLASDELKATGATGWPYQVVSIDLVKFDEKFPRLTPPAGASKAAKDGFLAFRETCAACHTINGEGGGKGPELNYPTNVTEYFSDAWISKWILDSRSIRFNSTMPSYAGHPDKVNFIKSVTAYLKAMSKRKINPQ